MKDKEALKLALEALNHYEKAGLATVKTIDAITAIKEALAQPEQEPNSTTSMSPTSPKALQPKQEPVAWITQGGKGWLRWHKSYDDNKGNVPLYTTPPQRTWVSLTDEDKKEYAAQDFGGNRLDAMDWAEKRLKEKNT